MSKTSLVASRFGIISGVALFFIAGIVYAPAVLHQIVDLDYSCWIQAVQPVSSGTLKRVVTCDATVWNGLGYFAPLTAVSFMADLAVGSWIGNPEFVHKTGNIVLHLLNSLLVMWLVRALRYNLWIAFTTSLIFALHPLQVSTVTWIAERKNLLMCFFFFIALLRYVAYRRDKKIFNYAAVWGAYLLALFAKPSAVALGPVIFFTDLCLIDRKFTGRSVIRAGLFALIGLIWVCAAAGTELPVENVPRLLDRLLQVPYNMGFLVWKFIAPTGLSLLYPLVAANASSFMWWLPSLLFVFVLTAIWIVHRIIPIWGVIWGAAFYVINVVPATGIVPFAGMKDLYVADHYQYTAGLGLCFLVSLAADRIFQVLPDRKAEVLKVGFAAALALILGFRCADQVRTWRNPDTLWRHVISLNPTSYRAHFNYATYLHENNRYSEAAAQYDLALAVGSDRPDRYKPYYNLGLIMMQYGNPNKAAEYLEKALVAYPEFGLPHSGLAQIHFDAGRYGAALSHCRLARKYGSNCPVEEMERLVGMSHGNTVLVGQR